MMVANTFDGGGTSRPLDQPAATTASQISARPTGSSSPSAGRAKRRQRAGEGAPVVASAGAAVVVSNVMAIAEPCLTMDCKVGALPTLSHEGRGEENLASI